MIYKYFWYIAEVAKSGAFICLLLIFSACSENNNTAPQATVSKVPASIQKLSVPAGTSIRAWLSLDNRPRSEMVIDAVSGTATVSIPSLSLTTHSVLIEYEFSNNGETLLLASASRSVDLSAGSITIEIDSTDYNTAFDKDLDGATNITELGDGTNPFGLAEFSARCFPLPVAGEDGSLSFNYEGDLVFVDGSNTVRLMDHTNCDVTTLITIPGESLMNVAVDTLRNRLYVSSGNSGMIYDINTEGGGFVELVNTADVNTALVMAPSSFEPFSNQLIIATSGGKILSFNPSAANPVLLSVTELPTGSSPRLAFASNGVLYATSLAPVKVLTLGADGSQNDFFVGALGIPVALSIDNVGSRALILDALNRRLVSLSIPSGEVTLVGSVNAAHREQGGLPMPGMAYNGKNTLLITSDALQIEARPARNFNTSCLPLSIAGAANSTASFSVYDADNLLFTTAKSNDISVLNRSTCSVNILASNVSTSDGLLGVIYDARLDMIYAGDLNNNIFAVNPTDGSSSLLISVLSDPSGLAIAPDSYTPYGGQLIAALSNGQIVAIDQFRTPAGAVVIASPGELISDLLFDKNGELYVANSASGRIDTVAASGTVSTFVSGLTNPDGLAIDNNGERLFITNAGDNSLFQASLLQVSLSDPSNVTVLTQAGSRTFSFSSGIFFDQYETLLYGVGETSLTIEALKTGPGENNSIAPQVIVSNVPARIQKLSVPAGTSIRAWLSLDNRPRSEMVIDAVSGTATVSIPSLSLTTHSVLIEYEFSNNGETLLLASASRSVDLSAGSITIEIDSADYNTAFDKDLDGATNITELGDGTNPFGLAEFSADCFPLAVASDTGSLSFNYEGDLVFVDGSNSVRLMDHANCNVTTLITIPGESLLSVVVDTLRNRLYVASGNNGVIYEINTQNGSFVELVNTADVNRSLVMAPSSFEPFSNQLIIATNDGRILSLDPSAPAVISILRSVTDLMGNFFQLAFASNGILYTTDLSSLALRTLGADGSLNVFFVGALGIPVALSIDNAGSRIFVLDVLSRRLVSLSIPSGVLTVVGPVNTNMNVMGGRMAYNGRNTLLIISSAAQIEAIPLPSP